MIEYDASIYVGGICVSCNLPWLFHPEKMDNGVPTKICTVYPIQQPFVVVP